MNNLVWSFIEVNVLLCLLFTGYLLVKNYLSLSLRRFLLMGIPLISVFIILLKNSIDLSSYSYAIQLIELDPVVINGTGVKSTVSNSSFSYEAVYGIVIALLLPVFLIRMAKVVWFFGKNEFIRLGNYKVYQVPGKESFSFFNHIQIKSDLSGDDRHIVLEHEKIHANQLHSLDIIIMEIYHLIFWINPVFFWIKQELVSLHEFQVDAIMYKTYRTNYLKFLVNYALGFSTPNYLLTSRFYNRLTIKKRIQSMKTNRKKQWWMVMVIPVFGCATLFTQCTKTGQDEVQMKEVVQEEPANNLRDEEIYDNVEVPPTFKGEDGAMVNFMIENIKYPEEAKAKEIEGIVYVEFVINAEGKIVQPRVLKSVDESLDAEALRVVSLMPDWNPGEQDGEKVAVKFVLPISFKLS